MCWQPLRVIKPRPHQQQQIALKLWAVCRMKQ
jgi:hypothetical protein